ncbi:P1 family peptidase [bacterium]|nr:P1 family peptidase [bacterium]
MAVVNALGDIVDPRNSEILAGARDPQTGELLNGERFIKENQIEPYQHATNTTLVTVATDAHLTKEEAIKVAQMAQDGVSRAIRPAHTPFDGDVVFSLALGPKKSNVMSLGSVAAALVAESIVRAVRAANQ